MHHFVGAAALGLALIASVPSFAMPITGTSTGTFSNIDDCHSGDCSITSSSHQLNWGSTSSRNNLVNPSTLKISTINIHDTTPANNVKLAKLTWFNSATLDSQTPDKFGVDYNLVIDFSSPDVTIQKTFDLSIVNTTNPTGDRMGSFTLPDLSSLTLAMPGLKITDLHYVVDGNGASFKNGVWFNKEGKTSNLYIEADFTYCPPPPPPTDAPEPATLALMGAGLLGLGKLRRKTKH
jgi:hypothetical protein